MRCNSSQLCSADAERRGGAIGRYAKIGAAVVGSAALLAVTGGMAAPAIVAGLSTAGSAVGLAGMASIGGAGSTAVLAAVFGTTGAGLVGYKLNRRLAGITDFSFVPVAAANAMSVTLVVSGYRPPARPPALLA